MAKNTQKKTSASIENRRKAEAAEAERKKAASRRMWTTLGIGALVVAAAVVIFYVWVYDRDLNQMVDQTLQEQEENYEEPEETVDDIDSDLLGFDTGEEDDSVTENADLHIPIDELGAKPIVYRAMVDGVAMEVIACKASDGSVITAFNTSETCQNTGKGYFVIEGDELVCQYCGTRVPISELGKDRDGCHPIPILATERKLVGDDVVIPFAYLRDNKNRFTNWGRL